MKCRRKACNGVEMLLVEALIIRKGDRMWIKPKGADILEMEVDPYRSAASMFVGMDLEPLPALQCPSCKTTKLQRGRKV